jgi:hypothetical protein
MTHSNNIDIGQRKFGGSQRTVDQQSPEAAGTLQTGNKVQGVMYLWSPLLYLIVISTAICCTNGVHIYH